VRLFLSVNVVATVLDSISLTVLPRSFLDVGSTIGVTCRIRYAGPELLSESQDPTMTLTLENTPDFLTNEEPQHTRPSTDDEMHTKTLVIAINRLIYLFIYSFIYLFINPHQQSESVFSVHI